MITVQQFLDIGKWRITGGTEYQWKSFGYNARYIDSDGPGYSMSMVFDTTTQVVYIVEIHIDTKAYRLVNPDFIDAFKEECKERGVEFNEATDTYNFIDLEVDEDWIEKASAIVEGRDYDKRIQVPLTLSSDEMFQLMKLAHANDITLNQMVERVLRLAIESESI